MSALDPSFVSGRCATCNDPLSLEVGITNHGPEGNSKLYCSLCSPVRGRGYTLADIERLRHASDP